MAELRQKLAAREFSGEAVEATLAALSREGLLSEARFIESFVASQTRRGKGPVWIRVELERRGIVADLAAAGLVASDADWPALAQAARLKRFGANAPADFRERARQARFLQTRGFTAGQVRQALDALADKGAAGAEPDDGDNPEPDETD